LHHDIILHYIFIDKSEIHLILYRDGEFLRLVKNSPA